MHERQPFLWPNRLAANYAVRLNLDARLTLWTPNRKMMRRQLRFIESQASLTFRTNKNHLSKSKLLFSLIGQSKRCRIIPALIVGDEIFGLSANVILAGG